MKLCTYCDIVYNESMCPLCKATDIITRLETEIDSLLDQVHELEKDNEKT